MELTRLDISESDKTFKVTLNTTPHCPQNIEKDGKGHHRAHESSSLENIKNNVFILGRGPLLQITDPKVSRLDISWLNSLPYLVQD